MVKRAGWVQVAFQVPEDHAEKLKELSEDSYAPQQLLREALRLLFEKHGVELRTPESKTVAAASGTGDWWNSDHVESLESCDGTQGYGNRGRHPSTRAGR